MLKFTKGLGIVALALVVSVGGALAQRGGHGGGGHGGGGWHGGGGYGGGWHGGGYRGGYYGGYRGGYYGGYYGGGWGWGPYWGGPYYYGPGDCGWVRVRVLRGGYWVVRPVWRCW